jgi:Amt family ammonium transporter
MGGVSILSQTIGSVAAIVIALVSGFIVYNLLDSLFGIRLEADEEMRGSDLTIHNLEAYPEDISSRFG